MLLLISFPSKNKQEPKIKNTKLYYKEGYPQLVKCKHFNLAKPCRTVYIQSEELHFRSNIAIVHLLQIAADNIKNGVTTLHISTTFSKPKLRHMYISNFMGSIGFSSCCF